MVPKNEKIRKSIRKNICCRSKFEVDRFRLDQGRIEASKTDRGRAKGGPSGLTRAIYEQNDGQNLDKFLAIILVTLTTLVYVCWWLAISGNNVRCLIFIITYC